MTGSHESQENEHDVTQFDGRALAKSAKEIRQAGLARESGSKSVNEILADLRKRAPIETMSPALASFVEDLKTSMKDLQEKRRIYLSESQKLKELVKSGASFVDQMKQAEIVERAGVDIGKSIQEFRFDDPNINQEKVAQWQKSSGGIKLMETARQMNIDVIQLTHKGEGGAGDTITLQIEFGGEVEGKGRLKKRTVIADKVAAKNV